MGTRRIVTVGNVLTDPFLEGAIGVRDTLKLIWKTTAPIWVDQWPLPLEKLRALQDLVAEQLTKGHIVPSTSPWNSPVFVIKKQSGKWRLLHDLRKINDVMEDMGALQPGLPSPTMIPRNWHLTVIDLKDCFFNIPLHPDDAPKFAFSVPSVNMQAPLQRYQWVVLPQGMKNSPTICQWYVAKILSPVRTKMPDVLLYHYMDDILVAAQHREIMEEAVALVTTAVTSAGLCIAPEKIQELPPWRYLGWRIRAQTISPQPLQLRTNIQNLHDVQKLLGTINWVRPLLGISNATLKPLFDLLKGDMDLCSPRSLDPEASDALQRVTGAITSRQAHRWAPEIPFYLIILNHTRQPYALIFQWDDQEPDPLLIIEWVFLPNQPAKTISTHHEMIALLIIRARRRLLSLSGMDFAVVYLPVVNEYLQWLLQQSEAFDTAIAGYAGQLSCHPPAHKLFNANFHLVPKPKRSNQPLQAFTVFTDGSGKSHKSVILWWDDKKGQWDSDIENIPGSPQIVELAAIVRVFRKWSVPLNIITDSAYVAGIVERAEAAVLRDISHAHLFTLLQELISLLDSRLHPYFIMHVRSHTSLPGFIAEGNRQADLLTLPVQVLPDRVAQAKLSHSFFHQNAGGLKRQFGLTSQQAANIIAVCPDCQKYSFPTVAGGVNPRGLQSLQLWQTDITHYAEFGTLKYVHSSIDTFSGALFSSCHTGEKARDARRHFMRAFATLGIPAHIKTDNGPAYTSTAIKAFLDSWGIIHTTGIPHSPTGQSLIERSHQSLKRLLQQQKGGMGTATPEERVQKALYVFNFLNCSLLDNNPPIVRHFSTNDSLQLQVKPPVLVRDPESGKIRGPYPLITWGRGYACVSTEQGPRWIPARNVRPFREPLPQSSLNPPAEEPTQGVPENSDDDEK